MATPIYEGSIVRFTTNPALSPAAIPFTSITGTIIDPDIVTFSYVVTSEASTGTWTTYTWTNGSGDPQNVIVHDTTGCFHADIDTSGKAGFWQFRWTGAPSNAVDLDSTKTKVSFIGETQIAATS